MTLNVDLDHATVVHGSPGLYDGLVIAQVERPVTEASMAEQMPATDTVAESLSGRQTVPGQGNDTREVRQNREARYRVERNEARQERDALQARIETLQTRELERLASKSLSNPADLLTLSGKSLADLLDENGDVDPDLVSDLVADVLGTRPGLKKLDRAVDFSQGHGNQGPGKGQPSFADLFRQS